MVTQSRLVTKSEYLFWRLLYSGKLKKFKDVHKGKSCFIIGNGPSLNQMDLKPLANHYTFGLNKIYMMEERGIDLNLSYLVSVNELVIEQSYEEFELRPHPVFLPYNKAKNFIQSSKNIHFIYTGKGAYFQKNAARKIEEGHTVTYVAMQLAFYMGFKTAYLIGVDHSFKAEGKANEKQKFKGKDVNHFDPNYFKGKDWHLPDLETSELYFRIAKYNYALTGREIFDATVGGKLEIFPKIKYEEALNHATKK